MSNTQIDWDAPGGGLVVAMLGGKELGYIAPGIDGSGFDCYRTDRDGAGVLLGWRLAQPDAMRLVEEKTRPTYTPEQVAAWLERATVGSGPESTMVRHELARAIRSGALEAPMKRVTENNLKSRFHGCNKVTPPPCPECGTTSTPVAHDTGDGWAWGIECDACGYQGECDSTAFQWPFAVDYAQPFHWELAGVRVV